MKGSRGFVLPFQNTFTVSRLIYAVAVLVLVLLVFLLLALCLAFVVANLRQPMQITSWHPRLTPIAARSLNSYTGS